MSISQNVFITVTLPHIFTRNSFSSMASAVECICDSFLRNEQTTARIDMFCNRIHFSRPWLISIYPELGTLCCCARVQLEPACKCCAWCGSSTVNAIFFLAALARPPGSRNPQMLVIPQVEDQSDAFSGIQVFRLQFWIWA